MFTLLLFIVLLVFYIWVIIYECIVCNNIRKACNIYINKNKFLKQNREEINHNESKYN